MKSYLKLLIASMLATILIAGCQSDTNEKIEIKMKSLEEQQEIVENFTYDDYKIVFEEVITEVSTYDSEAELMKKWIIRTLAMEKLYYETVLTKNQVIQLSKQALEEYEAWKTIAKNEYGITVSAEEIDRYIEEGPDTSDLPQHLAFADVLGVTIEDLNHTVDRDFYEKYVIWQKIVPVLEDKYGSKNNNKLVEKYAEEVDKKVNN